MNIYRYKWSAFINNKIFFLNKVNGKFQNLLNVFCFHNIDQVSPKDIVPPDFFPMTGVSYSYAPQPPPSEDEFAQVNIQ